MKLIELFDDDSLVVEDGRIVLGVNTTCDVGTDEIARQAKKWGFSVSRDGEPPNIWGTVKKN